VADGGTLENDGARMMYYDVAEVARCVFGIGALVCSVVGMIQDNRERRRLKELFAARYPTPEPEPAPLPPHVGTYRTNPRQQPSLPRKAPWWRLAMWRFRDGPERLKVARTRRFLAKHYPSDGWQMRQGGAEVISAVTSIVSAVRVADSDTEVPVADVRLEGARMRLYDEDGESALLDWTLGAPRDASRKERASTEVDCPTCCAVSGEPCCLNEH
jgi:hypothetical protein